MRIALKAYDIPESDRRTTFQHKHFEAYIHPAQTAGSFFREDNGEISELCGKDKLFKLEYARDHTLKKARKWRYEWSMSSTPHISRMECMESCAAPTSTVLHPRFAARMGPIVLPQAMSLRTLKSCVGIPCRLATSL